MNTAGVLINSKENGNAKTFVVVAGPALIALIPMAAVPAMPAMAAHFASGGDGAFFAQMVMTVPAILLILSATLAGFVAEIVGRRKVLLFALVLFAVAGVSALFVPNAITLIASRMVLGLAGGAILTTSFALAGDYHGAARERVLGYAGAAAAVAAIIALIVGGKMVDMFGWRGPFILYLSSLAVFAVALGAVKAHQHVKHEHGFWSPIRLLWKFLLLTMVLVIGVFMPGIQGPFLLQAEGVSSAVVQGGVIAASSLAAALAAGSFGYMRRHFSIRALLIGTAVCLGAGSAAIVVLHGTIAIALGFAIIGIGAGLVEPIVMTIVLSRAPETMHPRAVGMLLSAVFLGQFLNPLFLNPLRVSFGIHNTFFVIGLMFLLLAAAIALVDIKMLATARSQHDA